MNFFKSVRKFYLPVFLAYVIVSTAVIVIADLYRDPQSATFWRNIFWVELLLFVLWLPFLYFSRPTPAKVGSRQAAILPAITMVVAIYVALAGAVLLYNIFITDLGNTGVTIQIVLAAAALLVGLGLQLAMAQAEAGTEQFASDAPGAAVSPETLAATIRAAEAELKDAEYGAPVARALAGLRDDLANRLPTVGAITSNVAYAALCKKVWETLRLPIPASAEEAKERAGAVGALRSDIGLLVAQLRR